MASGVVPFVRFSESIMVDGGEQARAFAARDHAANPYRPDEQRVAAYLARLRPALDAGDDPVGTLIASHAALVFERQVTARAIERRIGSAVEAIGSQVRQDTRARGEPRVPRREEPPPEARPRP